MDKAAAKKAKKSKKDRVSKKTTKKKRSSLADSSDDDSGGSGGGGSGSSMKRLGVLVVLFVVGLILWSRAGGEDEAAAAAAAAAKAKQDKRRKRKGKKGDEDGDGEEESVSMEGVDVIQSKHGNLGWDKLQGPLVTKRPPRECKIRRIQPQMTTPFYIPVKKTKTKRRIYTCLRAGKQACPAAIMDDFVARRWKLKATSKPLTDRILSTFVLTDSITLAKLEASKPDVFQQLYWKNEGSTYLNALMGSSGLDGSIMEQFSVRSAFTKSFGCSYNALKIQPPQFRYDVSSDCAKMEKAMDRHAKDAWVLAEPGPDGNGEKLTLKGTKQLDPGSFCSQNVRVSSTRDSQRLATLVVPEPFKLEGKLFDVRSYILIGSTLPMMVFFRQGYVRQTSGAGFNSPYQFDQGASEISLEAFQEHLAREKITGSHYVDTFLQSSMKQVALFVFHAARTKIKRRRGSYQIFSVDFVIDKTFRVYLEKTSGHPELGLDHKMDMGSLVADMHDLVQELQEVPVAFEGMVKGDKYGRWELIFSELSETCDKIVYNPCHAFIDYNDKDLTKQNRKVGRVQQTAKRLDNEAKRIIKKTEEKKKKLCRERSIPYPGSKCEKFWKDLDQEAFNQRFAEHEKSFNPNDFRLPKPGEVFAHEIVN